jgi:hypothetical protein
MIHQHQKIYLPEPFMTPRQTKRELDIKYMTPQITLYSQRGPSPLL